MQIIPYGTWSSPLSADAIVADSVRLGELAISDGVIWWLEGRPSEGGRQVLVRRDADGNTQDMLPAPFSVRTRAHEYGGGALAVNAQQVWFCNDSDQRIYALNPGGQPTPITPEGAFCFAEAQFDARHNRLIAVLEEHTDTSAEPVNSLVAIDLGSGRIEILASGHDFYCAPRLHPDGGGVAFVTWDHPNMPWDGTELWVLALDAQGKAGELECIVGGANEAVTQPLWSPNGELFYISDKSGWWNLYRVGDHGSECVLARDNDFGKPHWQFGTRTYGFVDANRLICAWADEGSWRLGQLNLVQRSLQELNLAFTDFDAVHVSDGTIACLAGAPDATGCVTMIDVATERATVLRESAVFAVDADYLSRPESIRFLSGDFQVHAFFYPPANATQRAANESLPPLIVIGHGGPTGATSAVLNTRIQYWTTRGFAVVDVNYRGSTGFGRAYRDALKEQWGVADVEDCVNAARYLADAGRVDPERLAIRGGSAGGFTALAALVFHDTFKAGASHYGISELEALATDTHKFESRYLDSLIGPYPQMQARYRERSPIHHTDRLNCPVIFFQGLEDRVVPPNQAEMMVDALRSKGLPVAYLAFAGERHGFRRAETIKRTLEAELYFYGKVFGFTPADAIEPVEIENL